MVQDRDIAHLQRAQNAAAGVVVQKPSHLSSVDTFFELHLWPQRVAVRVAVGPGFLSSGHHPRPMPQTLLS